MFVDVCFPNNNEEEYIKVASALGTRKLCFVYKENKDIKLFTGHYSCSMRPGKPLFFTSNLELNQKKTIYYFDQQIRPSFKAPVKDITQVTLKNIAQNGILGISLDYLMRTGNFHALAFIIRIAKKTNTPIFIASFASSPMHLRDNLSLISVFRIISKDSEASISSLETLDKYIASFL